MHFQGPIKQNAVFAVSVVFFHSSCFPWAGSILGTAYFKMRRAPCVFAGAVKKKNLTAEEAPNVNVKVSLTPP